MMLPVLSVSCAAEVQSPLTFETSAFSSCVANECVFHPEFDGCLTVAPESLYGSLRLIRDDGAEVLLYRGGEAFLFAGYSYRLAPAVARPSQDDVKQWLEFQQAPPNTSLLDYAAVLFSRECTVHEPSSDVTVSAPSSIVIMGSELRRLTVMEPMDARVMVFANGETFAVGEALDELRVPDAWLYVFLTEGTGPLSLLLE